MNNEEIRFKNLELTLAKFADELIQEYIKKVGSEFGNSISYDVLLFGTTYELVISIPEHWKYIEYGRRPGSQPPSDAILYWIQKKRIKPRDSKMSERSLSFLIARSIKRKGIKPKPVIEPFASDFQERVWTALKNDLVDYKKVLIKILYEDE